MSSRALCSLWGSIALATAAPCSSQTFECVRLNEANTNLFAAPDACPAAPAWCDCLRSAFTTPVAGGSSGFRQAVLWILDQPGIGNHRVLVPAGTLDLSGIHPGDVVGGALVDELIPGSFPIVGGEFFTVRIELRATAVRPGEVDFDAVISERSRAVSVALFYDPLDDVHSLGKLYEGRWTSHGAGKGFEVEYRYAKDLIQVDPQRRPAVDLNEAGSPTFTIPLLFDLVPAPSGRYVLPAASEVCVTTTLRRFSDAAGEAGLDEVLEIGDADPCRIVQDPEPCRVFEETFKLFQSPPANKPPAAVINVIDGFALTLLREPFELSLFCGRARVLLRGRNSSDGDGGRQRLTHEWSVRSGPEGGARIPDATRQFKDTQVFFTRPGVYEIALRVDDGAAEGGVDDAVVTITITGEEARNVPPTAVITPSPDPPVVELEDGKATVSLDGAGSSNGRPGEDDCGQTLSFEWRDASAPGSPPSAIASPHDPSTRVEFSAPGRYVIELVVDDGASADGRASAQVAVTVRGGGGARFRRGDADGDGGLNLTDAVRVLGWLFRGDAAPSCLDAADADDDGVVNITDPIAALQYLFLGGAAPAPPGPLDCGPDVKDDELAECEYVGC